MNAPSIANSIHNMNVSMHIRNVDASDVLSQMRFHSMATTNNRNNMPVNDAGPTVSGANGNLKKAYV